MTGGADAGFARYGDQEGNIYDPVRAFELNKNRLELSPLPDSQDQLAYKYAKLYRC